MKGTQGFGRAAYRAAILITAATASSISACGSGASDQYDSAWVGDIETAVTVTGSVGDGPAVNASVTFRTKSGEDVATFRSNASGSYSAELSISKRHFPLRIDATGGTDIVTNTAPDFVLFSAVPSAREKVTANVNPFSTFAYHIAMDLNGGLTGDNLLAAEKIVASSLNSGLTTLADTGPMQTPVSAANAAEMIKASETLAEIVRRTRDSLKSAGHGVNADEVIEALASDLIDQVIEGNGGPRADARIAATASIVSAQVILEAMNNQLHVNGVDATDAIRSAIDQVAPGAADPALDQLGVTADMIDQASVGLAAAYAISGDARIAALMQVVAGVQPGMEAPLVRTMMPADYRSALGTAVSMAAAGNAAVVAAVNEAVRSNESSGSDQNRAPTISGQPPASVRAGTAYSFTPVASDLDGDTLTFSIAGRPAWAGFDSATGRLSGTPQAADARSYDGITITVSDGSLSSDLGPFTIVVTSGSSAPTISGSPPSTVSAGEPYSFTPRASDPDSSTLRFSISGKPSWATFDVVTGRLSGNTTSADVGLYRNITISVTDGTSSASLPAFAIEVVAAGAATGSVTLAWTPPTQNEDGSQISDLAAYRIYWGTESGRYRNSVLVNNPSVTRYVVDNLAPGTYEFVATSINSAGIESRFSNPVTRVAE